MQKCYVETKRLRSALSVSRCVCINKASGDGRFRLTFREQKAFCSSHPHIPVIDPWQDIEKVLDRAKISACLEACAVDATGEFVVGICL